MPSNTKYYLCQYFRFRLLFKAFVLSLAEKCSITIYYTIENGASRFIEKWNKPITRLFSKFVSVESFPFDVSQMKLEDGRTVMETCYYGTLYKFVEAAEETCLRGEKSLLKRLNKKLVANEDDIKFCIKHYFSFSIINQLLLVDLASWLLKNESSPLLGKEVGVIIDRKNYGTSFLLEYINEQKLNFMTVRTVRKLNENLIFVFVYHLTNLIVSCFTQNGKEKTDTDSPAKMCTYHYGDYGFSDFKNKRNYSLFWYPDSGIKPEEMIIFSQKTDEINEPDILKAQEQGFQLIACDGFKRTRNKLVKRHKCSITSLGNFASYFKSGLNLLWGVKNKHEYELVKILLLLLFQLPYWEDFFKRNNIKVLFKPGVLFSWSDVAAKMSGCALLSFQNSNILQTAMGHLECCDTYFVWGKQYSDAFRRNHSEVNNYVQTGCIYDHTFKQFEKKPLSLRQEFENNGVNYVISLFDENIQGRVFVICKRIQDGIIHLYEKLFQYAASNREVGLVVKPKLNSTRSILREDTKMRTLIDLLEKEGRLKFLDSFCYPIEAGSASDLAVGMVSNSTAALECSLAGIPMVSFNSDGSWLFDINGDGLSNKVIYDDVDELLKTAEQFRQDRASLKRFADRASYLGGKDPFRDGKANCRVGFYIKTLLSGINSGQTKEDAIENANRLYTKQFGEDKIALHFTQDRKNQDKREEQLNYQQVV